MTKIIQQTNDVYALYNTVVDDFDSFNLSFEKAVKRMFGVVSEDTKELFQKRLSEKEMTIDDCLSLITMCHGKKIANEYRVKLITVLSSLTFKLEKSIQKMFPNAYVNVSKGALGGYRSRFLEFHLISKVEDKNHRVWINDPARHIFYFEEKEGGKIKVEMNMGSIDCLPEEGSYLAMSRDRTKFRARTATPEKIYKALMKTFKNLTIRLLDHKKNENFYYKNIKPEYFQFQVEDSVS